MRTIHVRIAVAAVAFALMSNIAFSQNLEGITVQGTRVLNTKAVGQTPTGVTVIQISLSYNVTVADLDLASSAGAAELDKRVHDAAMAACREISRQYPDATPSDAECAKAAAKKAMVKVRQLVAAGSKSAK